MLALIAAKARQALVALGGRLVGHQPDALAIELSNGIVWVHDDGEIHWVRNGGFERVLIGGHPHTVQVGPDEVGDWVRAWAAERGLAAAAATAE